jgi:hypothetical protein
MAASRDGLGKNGLYFCLGRDVMSEREAVEAGAGRGDAGVFG